MGWTSIAAYLGCSVATAKRKEEEGLPVTRVGGAVCALSEDLDAWAEPRSSRAPRRLRRQGSGFFRAAGCPAAANVI